MYFATVTRFFFFFIWTLFLIPQVIESVNSIDHPLQQLSRLKRNPQGDSNDSAGDDVVIHARSGIISSEDTSNEKTRKALENDNDKVDENTRSGTSVENTSSEARRAADLSIDNSNEDTRRAASLTTNNSDEDTRRAAVGSDDNPNEDTRRAADPPKKSETKEKEADNASTAKPETTEQQNPRTFLWKKIMNNALKKALKPLVDGSEENARRAARPVSSEKNSDEQTRRAAALSSEEIGDVDTRRQAASSDNADTADAADENVNEETRRQAGSADNDEDVGETRRAAVNSGEITDDETRRQAVTGKSTATDDTSDEEEVTEKDTLEDTSDGETRRFQKNVNFNKNVNSNVQLDAMEFQREERYRPHYRPDANLQQYIPDDILEKLHTCDVFRDNIIFVMGYLLRLPDGQLSFHEYSSLELIYSAMKAKSIYIYNLLPMLHMLRDKSLGQQFAIVLKAINQNIPPYLKSTTGFWMKQINDRKINLDAFLSQTSEINILAGISAQAFSITKQRGVTNEMRAYDDGSRITQELMGPIYVTIFHHIGQMKTNFSQSLFGTIIRDLPNADNDPIFEEYARYIAEETWKDRIPNWEKHCRDADAKNPYAFVVSLVDDICNDDTVPLQMKKAFIYIRHHFTDSGQKVIRNVVRDTRTITENGLNITMLLKVVVPYHTDDIDEMKFRLRNYLLPSLDKDVTAILGGINRFKYNTPTELLLAFLARLQMRLPPNNDIQIVASALLANLLFPTAVQDIMIPENGPIAFWIIVDSILEPDMNTTIKSIVYSLQMSLSNDLKIWDKIQEHLLPTRHECTYPRKCLLTILEKLKTILKDNLEPSLTQKDILIMVKQLSGYVATNLEEKNSPQPCYDKALSSTMPSLQNTDGSPKSTKKVPKTTTKVSQSKDKSLTLTTLIPSVSTSESLQVTTKPPKISTKPIKDKSKSPSEKTVKAAVTEAPKEKSKLPKNTTKSPIEITASPKKTLKSSKEKSKLLNSTSESDPLSKPQEKKLRSSKSTTKSSVISSESSPETTKPHKTTSKTLKVSTVMPNTSRSSRIISKSHKITSIIEKSTGEPLKVDEKSVEIATKSLLKNIKSEESKSPKVSSKSLHVTSIPPQTSVESNKMEATSSEMATKNSKATTKLPKTTSKPSKSVDPLKAMTKVPKTEMKSSKPMDIPLTSTVNPESNSLKLTTKSTQTSLKPGKLPSALRLESNQSKSDDGVVSSTDKLELAKSQKVTSLTGKTSMLPPNMNAMDCIVFDMKSDDLKSSPSIYTQGDASNINATAVIYPSMIELHGDIHDDRSIVENVNQECLKPFLIDILVKLNETMEGSYEIQLLGKDWRQSYPTRISALMGMLKAALHQPKVISDTKLREAIERYRVGLQFIGPYVYLPMLSRWKNFKGEIVWSSIDLSDHDFSIIANAPPKETEKKILTLPIINPSYWVLPIDQNSGDPLPQLLPHLPVNNFYANKLKPLIDIFSQEKIKLKIGYPIDFSIFPNRGALLIHTLIRLKYFKSIQQDVPLFKIIKMYLKVLQRPALYIRIPQEVITGERNDARGGWTVDTADLMELLPKPKSPADMKLYESMRNFLSKTNLLAELQIPIPPMETTKGSFMKIIISKALKTSNIIDNDVTNTALKYYQDKFDSKNRGRMNLGWIWSQKFIVSTEMHLGELIEKLLPYQTLSLTDQRAYDDLVAYFKNHPHYLNTHSLPLTEYKTRGLFVRGFFENLLQESSLDVKVKENIQKLLPVVKLTGEGAKSMPPLARRALPHVRPA